MMKKLLFLFLTFLFLFMIGCGKTSDQKDPDPDPQPEEKTYEVTFVTNCETTATKQTVKKAEEIILPTLTKTGYTFKGFYLDSAFTTSFDKTKYTLSSDITLYALFDINQFTVTFIADGVKVSEQTVNYGESAIAPSSPTKQGYEFKGWDKAFTNVTEDLEIVANFEKLSFTVTFIVDGKKVSEQVVDYGASAVAPSDPTKSGYEFKGWDQDYSNITDDLEVVAKFAKLVFTVSFRLTEDDTDYYDIQEVEYGEDAETPDDPERTGFTFVDWDKDYTNVTKDLVITATWDAITFMARYYVDKALYAEVEVAYGGTPVPPADPVLDDYNFVGWDKSPTNVLIDQHITAILEPKSYKISYFSGDNELALEPSSYKFGDEFYLPSNDVTGYVFAGWFLDKEFKTSSIGAITKTQKGDLVLYSLNVKVELGSLATTWTFDGFSGTNTAAKGIDAVSNLPEQYERDFYKYLVDNNHLDDSRLNAKMKVTSWEEFSAVNPNHNGDPQRIWNDTSTNYVGGADGYSAFFLFDELILDENNLLKDIKGGFLGTEPYKTKYWNLTYSLVQMVQAKYNDIDFHISSATNNGFFAFVIDGYFYGTQGVGSGAFKELREVVPSTTTYYKYENSKLNSYTREYKFTTDLTSLNTALAIPLVDGKVFVGWYLDSELTKSVTDNDITQFATLYPKFE